VAREEITEEFVRHWSNLRARTGDLPSGTVRALGKNPDLAVSLQRLHEILERLEHHRRFGRRRLIGPVHPKFPEAFRDFEDRWRPYAYGRHWFAFKDFVRHHSVLVQETGNCPSAIQQALDKNPELGDSIRRLHETQEIVTEIVTTNSRSTLLFHAYPEFSEAFNDLKERWPHAYNDYENWQSEHARDWLANISIDDLLSALDKPPESKEAPKDDRPEWDKRQWHYFDPDRDSVGSLIGRLENFCDDEAWNFAERDVELEREYGQRAEGLTWLREIVGLDFDEIQTRWRDFPVILVPRHVADKSGPSEPRELFDYLVQIRLAYIMGADLAAISLCRATTEILMQYYYPSDQKITKDLPGLIRSVLRQPKFALLRKLNLIEKVRQAHDILHGRSLGGSTVDTLPHQNWAARGLARDWAKALHEMITNAPARSSAA
jgi:hypothetical protein